MSTIDEIAMTFQDIKLERFQAPYAADDDQLVRQFLTQTMLANGARGRIKERGRTYIEAIRNTVSTVGGLEDFLREYGLSTREGLALMSLAEALLRVPDVETQDRLIEDKIGEGDWDAAEAADTWFVTAATWGLGLSSKILKPSDTPKNILTGVIKRLGMPSIRICVKQAMRFLGHHFVLGRTIEEGLSRARHNEGLGYTHSYDMLGEGARTRKDAERYRDEYANAIETIGRSAKKTAKLPNRPGISVKLSALHPKYIATNRNNVLKELVPVVLDLAMAAKKYDLNFTIDAEEADRLELSLEVIEAVFVNTELRGWDGFGLAIQAYQKRASEVVGWVVSLCRSLNARMMVRLVKGAYWDTEVKRAQERGLDDFPVFTRKVVTDLSYLAAAQKLLDGRDVIFPQFATHNALTVATIIELAGGGGGYEFQRLHGMGEALFDHVLKAEDVSCRIYAPVGGHRDLLAYLVRRLLENGANSSFVSMVGDKSVAIDELTKFPDEVLNGQPARHPKIILPSRLYGQSRQNSKGVEFGCRQDLRQLVDGMTYSTEIVAVSKPLIPGFLEKDVSQSIFNPSNQNQIVGKVTNGTKIAASAAMDAAVQGFEEWHKTPVGERSAILTKAGDLLEANRDRLMFLLAREAGKTLDDGIAEIREAVDFCRYYAREAERLMSAPTAMPGPTGEDNSYELTGRGVFVCISPWNFPLAIFLGQITAALAAGNSVIAKPADQTPIIAFEAVKLLHKAGIPENTLCLVPGSGKVVGEALLSDPRVAGVAFTGSTATARHINRQLAEKDGPILPLIAETGGLNAMIVDATALPEQVADDVVMSAFRSAGQRCSALRLLYLQDDVADKMLAMIKGAAEELLLGEPSLPETDVGPVIDNVALERLKTHVQKFKSSQIVYQGEVPPNGTYMAPTIIELEKGSLLKEEVFGPILHVVRYKASDLDKVIDEINQSGYGLTFGVHSRVQQTISHTTDRVKAGNVYINRNIIGAVVGTQPFGGVGLSGTGNKAGGPNYLIRFCDERVVSNNIAAAGGNASLLALEE